MSGCHRILTCCYEGCGLVIALTDGQIERYKETHADFRCPAGHIQGYYGPSKNEKKIAELEQKVRNRDTTIGYYRQIVAEQRVELRSLRAKLGWRNRWLNGSREEVAA